MTQVFVAVFASNLSSDDQLPCLLILHRRSVPRSVSDWRENRAEFLGVGKRWEA